MAWNNTSKRATRGDAVTDAAALTSPATSNTTFTSTELDALRADVAALRTKLNALLAALRTGGAI